MITSYEHLVITIVMIIFENCLFYCTEKGIKNLINQSINLSDYSVYGTEQDRGAQIQLVLVLDYSVDGLEREDRNTVWVRRLDYVYKKQAVWTG